MSSKFLLFSAAFLFLLAAFLTKAAPRRLAGYGSPFSTTRLIPFGVGGGRYIIPLTPQQKADGLRCGLCEQAAKAAKAQGRWAVAENDYRAELGMRGCPFPECILVELGLMQNLQGKRAAAFQTYRKAFGIGTRRGPPLGGNVPEIADAAARCGLMCEDQGLHADACECYYTACRIGAGQAKLPVTLDPAKTSPAEARRLLGVLLHTAQSRDAAGRYGLF